jgi:cell division protein FtsZ
MGNDVRITLIATGFVNKAEVDSRADDELTRNLRGIKTEEELDVPSFLRRWNKIGQNRNAASQDKGVRTQPRSFNS